MCPGPAARCPGLLESSERRGSLGRRVPSFPPEFITRSPRKASDPVVSTGTRRTREGWSPVRPFCRAAEPHSPPGVAPRKPPLPVLLPPWLSLHVQARPGKGRGHGRRSSPRAHPRQNLRASPGGTCPASGGMDRPLVPPPVGHLLPPLPSTSPRHDSLTCGGGSAGTLRLSGRGVPGAGGLPGPDVCAAPSERLTRAASKQLPHGRTPAAAAAQHLWPSP